MLLYQPNRTFNRLYQIWTECVVNGQCSDRTDLPQYSLINLTGTSMMKILAPDFKYQLRTFGLKLTEVQKAQLNGFMLMQIFKIIKSAIPYIRWGISHHFQSKSLACKPKQVIFQNNKICHFCYFASKYATISRFYT